MCADLEKWCEKMVNIVKLYNMEYKSTIDPETRCMVVVHADNDYETIIEFAITIDSLYKNNNFNTFEPRICNDCIYPEMFVEEITIQDIHYTEAYEFISDDFDDVFETHIEPAMHILLHAFKLGVK